MRKKPVDGGCKAGHNARKSFQDTSQKPLHHLTEVRHFHIFSRKISFDISRCLFHSGVKQVSFCHSISNRGERYVDMPRTPRKVKVGLCHKRGHDPVLESNRFCHRFEQVRVIGEINRVRILDRNFINTRTYFAVKSRVRCIRRKQTHTSLRVISFQRNLHGITGFQDIVKVIVI